MQCQLIERVQQTRVLELPGAAGIHKTREEELWAVKIHTPSSLGTKKVWCDAYAPGKEFGPGTMFYAGKMAIGEGTILWLIAPNNRYYNLDNYERVGKPPMVTILNSPADWTLVDGVLSNGDRHSSIQISDRTQA